MKAGSKTLRTSDNFGNLSIDKLKKKKKSGKKPRPVKNPGGRSGLKKGAGG